MRLTSNVYEDAEIGCKEEDDDDAAAALSKLNYAHALDTNV